MIANANNTAGQCICSFSYCTDRIHVFEFPDENAGDISGYLFCFNTNPYFYSIAGGSEGLDSYLADTYAEYLHSIGEDDCLEKGMDEEDCYVLNDDTSMEFNTAFADAMLDAGFTQEESGRWVLKRKRKSA